MGGVLFHRLLKDIASSRREEKSQADREGKKDCILGQSKILSTGERVSELLLHRLRLGMGTKEQERPEFLVK